eukprot:15442939-Alexandrium_andersonii.AAC.1
MAGAIRRRPNRRPARELEAGPPPPTRPRKLPSERNGSLVGWWSGKDGRRAPRTQLPRGRRRPRPKRRVGAAPRTGPPTAQDGRQSAAPRPAAHRAGRLRAR